MLTIFSTLAGISPHVAVSEGTFFTTFLTEANGKKYNGKYNGKKFFLINFLLDFNNTRMIRKFYNNLLHFPIGDI